MAHTCQVRFQASREAEYWYFLYDANGREIRRQSFSTLNGANNLSIAVNDLPNGTYYVILGKPGQRILVAKMNKQSAP